MRRIIVRASIGVSAKEGQEYDLQTGNITIGKGMVEVLNNFFVSVFVGDLSFQTS